MESTHLFRTGLFRLLQPKAQFGRKMLPHQTVYDDPKINNTQNDTRPSDNFYTAK